MSSKLGNCMLVLLPAVALSPMPFQWVLKTSVGAFSTFWNLLFPQRFFKVHALSHSIMRSLLRQSSPHPFTERRISSLLRLQSHSMPMFFLLTRLKGRNQIMHQSNFTRFARIKSMFYFLTSHRRICFLWCDRKRIVAVGFPFWSLPVGWWPQLPWPRPRLQPFSWPSSLGRIFGCRCSGHYCQSQH